MPLVSDNFDQRKLNKNKINIKTKYIVGHNIYERNTDNSKNDDIISGIRCKKEYYHNSQLLHTETNFDSRIEYTFVSKNMENREFRCGNCGMTSKLKTFIDGCPYCRTLYNIEYTDKDLGSKYHYDLVLKSNKYKIVTAIIDIIISISLSFIFIITTSRTFNSYDISKIFIYGLILAMMLYYFFYLLDAYVILGPIKRYKQRQNEKQKKFWEETGIDKKSFYNNLNYEIKKDNYSKNGVIDYDILDYIDFKYFKKSDNEYVKVEVDSRIIYFINGKIKAKYIKDSYTLRKNKEENLVLKDGVNYVKCHNCGASIDVNDASCKYCHTKIKYLQKWILEK